MIENLDQYFAAASAILAGRIGEENAITIAELVAAAGIPSRRAAEQLLEPKFSDFPFPLVSSSRGYYVPSRAEEINHYLASLRSRAICIFIRRRTALRKAMKAGFKRQGKVLVDPPKLGQAEFVL